VFVFVGLLIGVIVVAVPPVAGGGVVVTGSIGTNGFWVVVVFAKTGFVIGSVIAELLAPDVVDDDVDEDEGVCETVLMSVG